VITPSYHFNGSSVKIALPELKDPEFNETQVELSDVDFKSIPDYQWIVQEGDTLGELFSMFNKSNTLTKILEADKNVLSLDVINKGDIYRFWFEGDSDSYDGKGVVLERMEQYLGIAYQVVFKRKNEGYEYKEIRLEGASRKVRVAGKIKDRSNFYDTAVASGLLPSDVSEIVRLLKTRMNFDKTFAGDRFQVILSKKYIDGVETKESVVEGVRFFNKKSIYSAFAFKGNYFDSKGEGLERAFARYPLKPGFRRVSSNFNPRRRHPITRLIRPHNGTDFAVSTGTSIYAPGDGVVKRVVRHKYAGLYIELEHSYKYRTRYLHLSKALVKKGQHIKRGQKIALSGNTGASTGPHLHYEFHVNQKPINAMGNKVPVSIGVDQKSKRTYERRVASLIRMMESKDLSSSEADKDKANKG
jgi:murein DD-endopeptidase